MKKEEVAAKMSKALAKKAGNIAKDKGVSLISRNPIKESEMSEERQYHRRMVRKAEDK